MENINFCQLRAVNRDPNFCVLSTPLGEHLLVLGSEQRETLVSVSAVPYWENILSALSSTAEGDLNFCVRSSPLGELLSVLGFEQRETLISASAVPDCGASPNSNDKK